MKFLFDFFPIILFFIAFKLKDIYWATGVAIIASIVQVGYMWFRHKRVETMHWITLALIVVFGGATLLLQDETFIKWKPTVLNWLFAAVFLGSQFIGKKSIAERMMGASIAMERAHWIRINLSWVAFFIFLGAANLYVMYNYDTETWVDFKVFGMLGLTLAFVLVQAVFISRHVKPDAETANSERKD